MPGTLSPEGRLSSGLKILGCSGNNFVALAKAMGVQISTSAFADGLHDGLDPPLAAQLMGVMNEMAHLQNSVEVPIAWPRVDEVARALVIRRVQKTAQELNPADSEFDAAVIRATEGHAIIDTDKPIECAMVPYRWNGDSSQG